MDATRADVEFTAEVIQIAIDEGATTINIPDTVGYTMPDEFKAFLGRLYDLVPGLRDVVLCVHCHDDLGLAVANSFAGLQAGARQVECAVNGIGERAGNASLEELIMLLHTRSADAGFTTGAVTTEIARTSRLVSRLTGYPVQPNKAIVGRNAFAHESGIHQDGVLKERTTYEIMDATTVGLDDANQIVLGKHSGRHALKQALAELGYEVDGAGAAPRVRALQGDRRQEEAGHRDGPRGARHRRAARGGARLRARVVRRRGELAAPAARDGRGPHARRHDRSRARSPATARSTRSSARSTRRPGSTRGCASSASTRSPAARTRSARRRSSSRYSARPARARASRPTSSRRPAARTCARSRRACARRRWRARGGGVSRRRRGEPELARRAVT